MYCLSDSVRYSQGGGGCSEDRLLGLYARMQDDDTRLPRRDHSGRWSSVAGSKACVVVVSAPRRCMPLLRARILPRTVHESTFHIGSYM